MVEEASGSPPAVTDGARGPAAAEGDGGSSPPERDWRSVLGFGGRAGLTDEDLLVHRRRDRVVIHIRNRPKPVVLHPTEVTELQERLRIAIAPEEPKAVDQHR